MAHPVVLGLNDCEDGERVFDLTNQKLLQLEDAAYAYRDDKDKAPVLLLIRLATVDKLIDALTPTAPP
jgi:uncharacterized membrane protein